MQLRLSLAALLCAAWLIPHSSARAETAQEAANSAVAQQLCACFVAGDIPTLLDLLTDDVHWQIFGSEDRLPMHGVRTGKEAVAEWFALVDANFAVSDAGSDEIYADGDTVILLGHESGTAKATGEPYSQRWCTFLTFVNGKISSFRAFDDGGAEIEALTPDN